MNVVQTRSIIPIVVLAAVFVGVALLPEAEGVSSLKRIFLLTVFALAAWTALAKSALPDGALDPFSVYAWLMALVCLCALVIWGLTFVGPLPVIGGTLVLGGTVAVLVWRRNEPLRHQRAVSGKCTECGYDLRESTERCPECGSDLPEELQRRRRIAAELRAKRQPGADHHDDGK